MRCQHGSDRFEYFVSLNPDTDVLMETYYYIVVHHIYSVNTYFEKLCRKYSLAGKGKRLLRPETYSTFNGRSSYRQMGDCDE